MRTRWIANFVIGGAALTLTTSVGFAQAVKITPVGPGTSTPQPAPAAPAAPATTGAPAVIVPVNPNNPAPSSTVAPAPAAAPAQTQTQMMSSAPAARKLQVSFANGNVTVIATNVTLREILAEWSRQGGTKFVDAEKLTGGPVSFEFRDRPEAEVLTALLRNVPGYAIGGKRNTTTGSKIGTVALMPVRATTPSSSGFVAPPPPPMNTMPDDELPPVMARPQAPPTPTPVTVAPVGPAAPGTTGTGRGGGPGGY